MFEGDLSNTFIKNFTHEISQEEADFPTGFSNILTPNGKFFLMTYDRLSLVRWFIVDTDAWTSETIVDSDKKNYMKPALAPDESYFLTTIDNNDINI